MIHEERAEIEEGKVIYWMQDECHQLHGDSCGYVWSRRGERVSIEMENFRHSQTWYGALNIYSGEFLIDRARSANSESTIEFIKWLVYRYKEARHVIIWDGATHHRSEKLREYLRELNSSYPISEWKVRLVFFAPNAPEQNPVEDIWLQGKNWVRKNIDCLSNFTEAKSMFEFFLSGKVFKFKKIKDYFNYKNNNFITLV